MKYLKLKHFLLFCAFGAMCINSQAQDQVRVTELFNFDWKFKSGEEKDAGSIDYDDSNWRKLDIPHDFQIEQPWTKSGKGARGFKEQTTGWYRKTFDADPAWKDRRVLLDFEGVMLWGEVWFNGKRVAIMDYGYLGCEADITEYINYEGKNVVAVYASTKGNSRWYTGGGLFRDVNLILKDSISIARHGVFITTPTIDRDQAQVAVQVELDGFSGKNVDMEIVAKIFAPSGEQVAETKTLAPKKIKLKEIEVPLPIATVTNPQLWSCETPNLYTAEVSLFVNGKTIDNVRETFGIRTIEYSPEFGFKLNGEKVFLKGISNHHDLGAVGAAAFDRSIERQFEMLKKFGYNHIRTSHNPYSKSFLQLADKYGILVVDELFDKWSEKDYWPARKPFSQLWYTTIPEWIKRDRNHPSVILWSLGNELQMREDLAGFPTGDWGITTYKILDVLVKRYDPTRKTTVAMHPSRANAVNRHDSRYNIDVVPPELSLETEVASFNYQFQAYEKYLEYAPNLIVYQSEATTSELTAPFFGMDYDKMVGIAYWGAIEYWGESNGWPKKGWNYSFFNHTLEPYPQAYLIKSAFSDEPLVYIGVVDKEGENIEWNDVIVGRTPISSNWNRKENSIQNLFTYTNADEVELFVNGKSMGIQKNNREDIQQRNIIYWQNIPYGKGGHVLAVARTQGKEVARHKIETTGKAVGLRLEMENADWKANGMDLQYVRVYAVDSKGRKVPTKEGNVTFQVTGSGKLLAVDNGNHYTDELFNGNTIKMHNGFVMAILRSDRSPGEVKLSVKMEDLKQASLKFTTR